MPSFPLAWGTPSVRSRVGGLPVLGAELGTSINGSRASKTKTLYLRLGNDASKSNVEIVVCVQRKRHPFFNAKSARRQERFYIILTCNKKINS